MTDILAQHMKTLRGALLARNAITANEERDWLMGKIATVLLEQDEKSMDTLRDHLADLAPLADEYGDAKPGDRWRAIWEILHAFCMTIRPLEQVRMAAPGQMSGQLMLLIRDTSGITPTDLAARMQKKINHISNTLKGLVDQGLVHRVPQGRASCYYLSDMGREALTRHQTGMEIVKPTGFEAIKVLSQSNLEPLLPYLNPKRRPISNTRNLPANWLEQR